MGRVICRGRSVNFEGRLCLVDRASRDLHVSRDFGWCLAISQSSLDLGHIDLWLAPTVDAPALRGGDPLGLALTPEIGFELGKDPEHVEKRLAGRGRGVDGLLRRRQMGAFLLQSRDNGLQIAEAARQPVDARDHKRFARLDECQDGLQLVPPIQAGSALLLGPDHAASSRLQGDHLCVEVLIYGRGSRIADHVAGSVHFGYTFDMICSLSQNEPKINSNPPAIIVHTSCQAGVYSTYTYDAG